MKYLNLYSDQASAVGQIVNTPNVCVIDGMDKTLFIPASAGNLIGIIKDDDFINYTDPTELQELEGDMLLKFAVDVKKGTTLFVIDSSTEVTANDDYKAGDYLYFSKGTFHPNSISFSLITDDSCDYYSEVRWLKDFDCSNMTSMRYFVGKWGTQYNGCQKITKLDVSYLDTSKVQSMLACFNNLNQLKQIDVSNFNTHNVVDMTALFCLMKSLPSLDVSNFDTSKVTYMGSMFYNCSSLTNLIFGSKWGTQTSTAADALTLDLSYLGSSKSYKLTDETYNSMLTMYDRASNGLTTMTIKFSTKHNLPDGFAEKMSALGYTITLV